MFRVRVLSILRDLRVLGILRVLRRYRPRPLNERGLGV